MDQTRFDDLTRRLGAASTRRAGLKATLGGLLGVAVGLAALPATDGEAKKKKKRALCPSVCPSGSACVDGVCACSRALCGGTCCAGNQTCQGGACVETGLRDCGTPKLVDGGDYSYCKLNGKRFETRALRNANFEGAYLGAALFTGQFQPWGCRFDRADLGFAYLRECDIKPGTTFVGADLTAAAVKDAHIDGADFSQATLERTDFTGTHIARTRFDDADLSGATFADASITGCQFPYARLAKASIANVRITDSGFVRADLGGSSLINLHVVRTDFRHAGFAFSSWATRGYENSHPTVFDLTDCVLDDADLTLVNFKAAWFAGSGETRFINCSMKRVRFMNSLADDVESAGELLFTTCDLTGAKFDHSELRRRDFTDCILDNADFSWSTITVTPLEMSNTTFTRCSMKGANLDHLSIVHFDPCCTKDYEYPNLQFADVDLTGATFGDAWRRWEATWLRTTLTDAAGWRQPEGGYQYLCSTTLPSGSPAPDANWYRFNQPLRTVSCSQAPARTG